MKNEMKKNVTKFLQQNQIIVHERVEVRFQCHLKFHYEWRFLSDDLYRMPGDSLDCVHRSIVYCNIQLTSIVT
jgi:hypothetical protein